MIQTPWTLKPAVSRMSPTQQQVSSRSVNTGQCNHPPQNNAPPTSGLALPGTTQVSAARNLMTQLHLLVIISLCTRQGLGTKQTRGQPCLPGCPTSQPATRGDHAVPTGATLEHIYLVTRGQGTAGIHRLSPSKDHYSKMKK